MKKKTAAVFLLAGLVFSISGCSRPDILMEKTVQMEQHGSISMDEEEWEGMASKAIQTAGRDSSILEEELPDEMAYIAWDSTIPIQMTADFEDDVAVYTVCREDGEMSVLVDWAGLRQEFDWAFLAGGYYSMNTDYLDIDKDGKRELIVIEKKGQGTGVSISDLYIVEPDAGGKQLISCQLPDELRKQAVSLLQLDCQEESITLSLRDIDQKVVVPCGGQMYEPYFQTYNSLEAVEKSFNAYLACVKEILK